jgi:hypothetical protein
MYTYMTFTPDNNTDMMPINQWEEYKKFIILLQKLLYEIYNSNT